MKTNELKILKRKLNGDNFATFVIAWINLLIIACRKSEEEISAYKCVNKYIDSVLADSKGYKEKLKSSGQTEELKALEEAEKIMDLKWWKYFKDFYHFFNCGIEMGLKTKKPELNLPLMADTNKRKARH